MRRYQLPYWAFVPTLGVWPKAAAHAGAEAAGTEAVTASVPLPASGAVAVNLEDGEVTVADKRPGESAAAEPQKRPRLPVKLQYPNTPSIGGPSWLRKTATVATTAQKTKDKAKDTVATTTRPVTRILLKPSARAKAGAGGVALSNPISTAVVRRGDTVSIEYLPDATAEAGEGGVAISRPELVIQLVD